MSYTQEQIDLQKRFWDFCTSKGMKENAIAGAMGNISQESSWDITLEEVGGGGYGLIQWTGSRRTQLEAYGIDEQHQFEFFYSELTDTNTGTTGATSQWSNANSYTYNEYISGTYSVSDSVQAFCWCFERPAVATANIEYRISEGEAFYTTFYNGQPDNEKALKLENAVQWCIDIANDDSHGYDQDNRWSPDYDCSSFIISAFEQAGIPLKTDGATYTGDMKAVCLKDGFVEVAWGDDESKLIRGDILLNEVHHVCMYIGDGQIVQASANEFGTARGGETGDQTGEEISIKPYYVYSSGWDCVLRYETGGVVPPIKAGEVYAKIEKSSYNVKQLSAEEITFLKTLSFNDIVKMKFSFNHNKRQIGKNYLGNKLTFDNKEYKIKDVRSNGYIILVYDGSLCHKYINPKYVTK